MKPVDQAEADDCFRACLASVLELPLVEVPHFVALGELPPWGSEPDVQTAWGRAFYAALNAWLDRFGLCYFEATTVEPLVETPLWTAVPPGYWIATGETAGGEKHAVVMRGREVAHDPDPQRRGVVRLESVGVLVVADPSRALA